MDACCCCCVRTLLQCDEDAKSALVVAHHCLVRVLAPHLGGSLVTDPAAADQDLWVGLPYEFMTLMGGSVGLAGVLAMVSAGRTTHDIPLCVGRAGSAD